MSRKQPPFSEADLAVIAKCIDSAATHTELDSLLRDVGLVEPSERSGLSKWQRIYNALANAQNSTGTGNFAMRLIQTVLSPKRFVQRATEFDGARGVPDDCRSLGQWPQWASLRRGASRQPHARTHSHGRIQAWQAPQ
jgi:hypothetical protein